MWRPRGSFNRVNLVRRRRWEPPRGAARSPELPEGADSQPRGRSVLRPFRCRSARISLNERHLPGPALPARFSPCWQRRVRTGQLANVVTNASFSPFPRWALCVCLSCGPERQGVNWKKLLKTFLREREVGRWTDSAVQSISFADVKAC